MLLLDKIMVVLVEPSHPGNIGAVARSMKTMGLSHLVMVKPKKFPHYEASKRAAGAESVLLDAHVVDTVEQAVAECSLVLGTSVRDREVSWPTISPRLAAEQATAHLNAHNSHRAAILFGRESSGLSNEELDLGQAQIRIDANSDYSSLNLASAVQIICYEMRVAMKQGLSDEPLNENLTRAQLRQRSASEELRAGHLQHLQETLEQLDFVKSKPPTMLMRKLTRLYNKADLSIEEIQILRGILSAIQNQQHRS